MSLPQSLARAVAACLVVSGAAGAQSSSAVAFTNATVVDVRDGRRLADHTVVVEGTRIASVGPSASIRPPAGATVVDARGKFVIPGMWDMHVHFDEDALTRSLVLPLLVANGVTGVREMWADCIG